MSAKIELNHRIHVLTCKEELDGIRVPGKVVVVLDILFATTTMVAALAHGATEVLPVASEAEARAAGAKRVYCGSLLNARAIVSHIAFEHPRDTVLILCSSSGGNFNLEDFYGAGCMVDRFAGVLGTQADFSDAARTALAFFRHAQAPQVLLDCRVGRMMVARGLAHEVEFACRFDAFPIVPVLDGDKLRCA